MRLIKLKVVIIFILISLFTVCFCSESVKFAIDSFKAYKNNDFETGIELATKSINIDSTKYLAYYYRSLNFMGIQQYNYALTDINKAIYYYPSFNNFYIRMIIYNLLNEYELAKKDSTRLKVLNIFNLPDIHLRSKWYLSMGNFESALNDVNFVLKSEPNNPNCLNTRSRIYLFKKDIENAKKDVETALQKAWDLESESMASLIYSMILFINGNLDDSKRYFNNGVKGYGYKNGDFDFLWEKLNFINSEKEILHKIENQINKG